MIKKIGQEFQCLQNQGQNSNLQKNRVRIPMFEQIELELRII